MHSAAPASHTLQYLSLRNISCPEDVHGGRKVFVGACKASELLQLSLELGASPSPEESHATAAVEDAIRYTLRNSPNLFPVLNRGVTLVIGQADVDDARRTVRIVDAQLVDGATTLRCLRAESRGGSASDPSVRLEIIVTTNDDLALEVEAGRRRQRNASQLLSRDTATVAHILGVGAGEQEILRVACALIALMPPSIFTRLHVGESKSVVSTSRRKCMGALADALAETDVLAFCRQMLPAASAVDAYWRSHPILLNGAPYVAEGLLLPLLCSLAMYVSEQADETGEPIWRFISPRRDAESVLATEALALLKTAEGDSVVMGMRSTSYNILRLAARLLRDQRSFEEAA